VNSYKSFYYISDPNTQFIGSSNSNDEALIQQLHAKGIKDDVYRQANYDENGFTTSHS